MEGKRYMAASGFSVHAGGDGRPDYHEGRRMAGTQVKKGSTSWDLGPFISSGDRAG
jgi:hypothetical protein